MVKQGLHIVVARIGDTEQLDVIHTVVKYVGASINHRRCSAIQRVRPERVCHKSSRRCTTVVEHRRTDRCGLEMREQVGFRRWSCKVCTGEVCRRRRITPAHHIVKARLRTLSTGIVSRSRMHIVTIYGHRLARRINTINSHLNIP